MKSRMEHVRHERIVIVITYISKLSLKYPYVEIYLLRNNIK
jgi:hypothetical protein